MSSEESLDPQVVEAALDQCAIGRSCVVDNNFPKAASQVVCAIIKPSRDSKKSHEAPRNYMRYRRLNFIH